MTGLQRTGHTHVPWWRAAPSRRGARRRGHTAVAWATGLLARRRLRASPKRATVDHLPALLALHHYRQHRRVRWTWQGAPRTLLGPGSRVEGASHAGDDTPTSSTLSASVQCTDGKWTPNALHCLFPFALLPRVRRTLLGVPPPHTATLVISGARIPCPRPPPMPHTPLLSRAVGLR